MIERVIHAALVAVVLGCAEHDGGSGPTNHEALTLPPTGLHVMVRRWSKLESLSVSSDIVKALKRPYVRGVTLFVRWEDLQPSAGASPDASRIRYILDQLDQAATLAGRPTPPIQLRLYPTGLPPGWSSPIRNFRHSLA